MRRMSSEHSLLYMLLSSSERQRKGQCSSNEGFIYQCPTVDVCLDVLEVLDAQYQSLNMSW